jgi:hypothetical protein
LKCLKFLLLGTFKRHKNWTIFRTVYTCNSSQRLHGTDCNQNRP